MGKPGRDTVSHIIPTIKKKYNPDLILANGENASHGSGITGEHLEELLRSGINLLTSGNHIWQKKEIVPFIEKKESQIIRPANYSIYAPGKGYQIIKTSLMKNVLVINLIGRVFFAKQYENPFHAVTKILDDHKHINLDAIIVDFHAEATSEKIAMMHYLDGKVSAIIGTHTHVPTADYHVTDNHTAYITDVGMTGLGYKNSIIGVNKESVLYNFITQMPVKHKITDGPTDFNSVLITIEDDKKATEIIPINYFDIENMSSAFNKD